MSRAKFQVLIIPYRIKGSGIAEFAVVKRIDVDVWQFLSGGGEDNETPMEAAKREANGEGGIPYGVELLQLDSTASVPACNFPARKEWGNDIYVVPEYSFAVEVEDLTLGFEHTEMKWVSYEDAIKLLTLDSNKTALWELKERITRCST